MALATNVLNTIGPIAFEADVFVIFDFFTTISALFHVMTPNE